MQAPERIAGIPETTRDCWFVTGPTAAGKTKAAIELARRIDGEILSMDSMAIYRGMDVGTAKPTPEQRREIPHHLLDLVVPSEEFSLAQYLHYAVQTVADVRSRGKQPIFVGGTPLYLKALLRGVFEGPPADWEFRQAIEREAAESPEGALHDRLALVDPLSAAKLHPHDSRRIIRALEVFRVTGQPISHLQLQFDDGRSADSCRAFWISWERKALHDRIERRVEGMMQAGFVEETRALLDRYGGLGRTAAQAVGYREVIAYLRQETSLAETVEAIKTRTRQFARRQETWYRSLRELRSLPQEGEFEADAAAERMIESADASIS